MERCFGRTGIRRRRKSRRSCPGCTLFLAEYDVAVANYPVPAAMRVISLLCDYDYKGKGGEVGEATPADLLMELVNKILNV